MNFVIEGGETKETNYILYANQVNLTLARGKSKKRRAFIDFIQKNGLYIRIFINNDREWGLSSNVNDFCTIYNGHHLLWYLKYKFYNKRFHLPYMELASSYVRLLDYEYILEFFLKRNWSYDTSKSLITNFSNS